MSSKLLWKLNCIVGRIAGGVYGGVTRYQDYCPCHWLDGISYHDGAGFLKREATCGAGEMAHG